MELVELNARRSKFEFIMSIMRIWANENLHSIPKGGKMWFSTGNVKTRVERVTLYKLL